MPLPARCRPVEAHTTACHPLPRHGRRLPFTSRSRSALFGGVLRAVRAPPGEGSPTAQARRPGLPAPPWPPPRRLLSGSAAPRALRPSSATGTRSPPTPRRGADRGDTEPRCAGSAVREREGQRPPRPPSLRRAPPATTPPRGDPPPRRSARPGLGRGSQGAARMRAAAAPPPQEGRARRAGERAERPCGGGARRRRAGLRGRHRPAWRRAGPAPPQVSALPAGSGATAATRPARSRPLPLQKGEEEAAAAAWRAPFPSGAGSSAAPPPVPVPGGAGGASRALPLPRPRGRWGRGGAPARRVSRVAVAPSVAASGRVCRRCQWRRCPPAGPFPGCAAPFRRAAAEPAVRRERCVGAAKEAAGLQLEVPAEPSRRPRGTGGPRGRALASAGPPGGYRAGQARYTGDARTVSRASVTETPAAFKRADL